MKRQEMKRNKHIIALLASLMLLASSELFGIVVQEFHMPADSYYSAANLKKLNVEEKRKHAPIMILLDRRRLERPARAYLPIALTLDLSASIKLAFYPIITSASLLHNYLIRNKNGQFGPPQPFTPNQWQIYDIEGTQFVLLVPNKFLTYYPFPSVGLKPAREKSTLDKIFQQGEDQLLDWLSTEKLQAKKTTFSVQDLEKIFMTPKDVINPKSLPIWDIYFSGHGEPTGRIIADLKPTEMQQTLSWFNENIQVGVLYLLSCYAGGKNINLLQFEKNITNRYIKPLNYIMIVGSITDTPVILENPSKLLINFFDKAAKIAGKGKTLNELLIAINTINRYSGSMHGMHNIPQVWLPGGLGFQTFNVDKRVFSLGKVKMRALEYQKKPFIIVPPSTRAVLLYTETIKVPLGILPYDQKKLIVSTLQKPVPSAAQILLEIVRRSQVWK